MKTFVAVIALSLLLPSASYGADVASDKSIRELMSATGAGNMGVQAMQNMLPALKQMLPQVPDTFWNDFMKEVNPNDLVNQIVPIYKRHFTEQEIQEFIKFYKSPAGRKFVEKQPLVMNESMAAGQEWGKRVAQRAIEKAQASKNAPAASP